MPRQATPEAQKPPGLVPGALPRHLGEEAVLSGFQPPAIETPTIQTLTQASGA